MPLSCAHLHLGPSVSLHAPPANSRTHTSLLRLHTQHPGSRSIWILRFVPCLVLLSTLLKFLLPPPPWIWKPFWIDWRSSYVLQVSPLDADPSSGALSRCLHTSELPRAFWENWLTKRISALGLLPCSRLHILFLWVYSHALLLGWMRSRGVLVHQCAIWSKRNHQPRNSTITSYWTTQLSIQLRLSYYLPWELHFHHHLVQSWPLYLCGNKWLHRDHPIHQHETHTFVSSHTCYGRSFHVEPGVFAQHLCDHVAQNLSPYAALYWILPTPASYGTQSPNHLILEPNTMLPFYISHLGDTTSSIDPSYGPKEIHPVPPVNLPFLLVDSAIIPPTDGVDGCIQGSLSPVWPTHNLIATISSSQPPVDVHDTLSPSFGSPYRLCLRYMVDCWSSLVALVCGAYYHALTSLFRCVSVFESTLTTNRPFDAVLGVRKRQTCPYTQHPMCIGACASFIPPTDEEPTFSEHLPQGPSTHNPFTSTYLSPLQGDPTALFTTHNVSPDTQDTGNRTPHDWWLKLKPNLSNLTWSTPSLQMGFTLATTVASTSNWILPCQLLFFTSSGVYPNTFLYSLPSAASSTAPMIGYNLRVLITTACCQHPCRRQYLGEYPSPKDTLPPTHCPLPG